ncbi:MAG: hypothetical protein RQ833_10945 [Sphingomonadaceae bacterium]|nr:hypothetical protein [Sphingomonadaceae bacterium]
MRLPLGPTLLTLVGVPSLVGLGVWQLERREEKRVQLIAFDHPERGRFRCDPLAGPLEQRSGERADGRPGWAHRATCVLGGARVPVVLGWAADPVPIALGAPATVTGLLFTVPDHGRLLVLTEPPPPLQPSRPPGRDTIANNHLSYAIQWFSFATILGVGYGVWLRRSSAR